MSRPIRTIVIHCSDSPNGRSLFTGRHDQPGFVTPVLEIDRWHRERGFRRDTHWRARQNPELAAIGYHFVIYLSGAVATGRHLDEVGAHARGHNSDSIGICLIGRDAFTAAQWLSLKELLEGLRKTNPGVHVIGHGDLDSAKTCPNFQVATWLESGCIPMAGQVCAQEPGT